MRLAVNARARRVSLRLDRRRSEFVATAPHDRSLSEAVAFARERADWLLAQSERIPERRPLRPGMRLALFGEETRLEVAPGRARWLASVDDQPARMTAPDDAAYSDRIIRLVKTRAKMGFELRTKAYVSRLGQPEPSVKITDTRGRWGSCRPAVAGAPAIIRYNWRLAMAPVSIADYVAAHECAHLLEPNHGPKFWALVERLFGAPAPAKRWLAANGAALHAVGGQALP